MEIAAALSSIKAGLELAKVAMEARDDTKIKDAMHDLNGRLYEAMSSALTMAEKSAALQSQLRTLESEKADLQSKLDERGLYNLHAIKPGVLVYASQPPDERGQPPEHYLCQSCYDKGIKSVLRFFAGRDYMGPQYQCTEDNKHTIYM